MLLEVYKFIPRELINKELIESDMDELFKAYAMANYIKDVEVSIMQRAIVKAFGDE